MVSELNITKLKNLLPGKNPIFSVLIGLMAVFLLVYPFIFTDPFPQHLMIMVFMYVVLSQSWNLLGGFVGQVSIGHVVYFGVGAYAMVLMQTQLGLPAWVAFFLGGLATVPLSYVIGVPTFKLGGHYFAIATIAVGEVMRILFQNWDWVGGNVGLVLPMVEEGLWNFQFHQSKTGYYYIGLLLVIFTMVCIRWIQSSKMGYYFRAIKGDQNAAASLAVNPARYKLIANAISAILAGLAGGFYANYVLFIDPPSVFASKISVLVMLTTVLGGAGTLWGPLIGTAVLIPVSELSRVYWGGGGQGFDQIVYGALIVILAVFQPAGLLGLVPQIKKLIGREKRYVR
jgi:branched-chain amino acid transport system permease protein